MISFNKNTHSLITFFLSSIFYFNQAISNDQSVSDKHFTDILVEARTVHCPIWSYTREQMNAICSKEPCGSVKHIVENQTSHSSGRYCPGAYHAPGWPANMCPLGSILLSQNEVRRGGELDCGFQGRKLQMNIVCGTERFEFHGKCNDINNGVDTDILSKYLNSNRVVEQRLGNIIVNIKSHSILPTRFKSCVINSLRASTDDPMISDKIANLELQIDSINSRITIDQLIKIITSNGLITHKRVDVREYCRNRSGGIFCRIAAEFQNHQNARSSRCYQ
ncbi:MAG: hypothetical protein JAY94_14710 [Candidatus Thiodiazotropha endolucinida]|nr:hypothetical protein [Candidatus Thiodiazotropha taylori]MCW4318763.1 hypothetical protein [Candidatus Thiodiazotropha taylori]